MPELRMLIAAMSAVALAAGLVSTAPAENLGRQSNARHENIFLGEVAPITYAEVRKDSGVVGEVELIREQAALSTDPETLSQRIDNIAATLGGTSQWIRDQQQVYGAMEDLLSDAPPVATGARARESQ